MRGFVGVLVRCFDRFWALGIPFPGIHMPLDAGREEAREELDLAAPGEPHVSLPNAQISEVERQEAVRRYKRELEEERRR